MEEESNQFKYFVSYILITNFVLVICMLLIHMFLFLWCFTCWVANMRLEIKATRCKTYLMSGFCVAGGCSMMSHYCSLHWDPLKEVEVLVCRSGNAHAVPCHLTHDAPWWWHLVPLHYCIHDDVSWEKGKEIGLGGGGVNGPAQVWAVVAEEDAVVDGAVSCWAH
jgi:hypothetical protein